MLGIYFAKIKSPIINYNTKNERIFQEATYTGTYPYVPILQVLTFNEVLKAA